ncbi:MAG TPA: aminotransferase class V-fold PLP-dependent enzyme, partial [Euryarchaeota archaeon]|nr:aminotransferase class V-fold PLP-dependent enzyme [Euryarchaeota archaeon]
FTSGGSEANILGMYLLRKVTGKKYVIAPKTAHFSFVKAENLGIIKLKFAEVDERLRVDPDSVESLIDNSTAGIIGVAVNTDAGTIDPIEELNELAHAYDLYVYVDAALGGLLLPFMKVLGREIPKFDFSLERVAAIGVDPHKFGLVPPPAGMFLFRKNFSDNIAFDAPYYLGNRQYTIVSTRPAWPPVAFWAVIKALGRRGFVRLTEKCLRMTSYARKRIEEEGFEVPIEPETIIVNIKVDNPRKVAMELKRKYRISVGISKKLSSLRLVIMPHVNEKAIDRLLEALNKLLDKR